MRSFVAVLALVAGATAFTGDGTAYNLDSPNHGNCNFMHYPPAAKTNFVAVAPEHFAKTKGCGKCVQVQCTDPKCQGATTTEILYVVDQCPGCGADDLDFSRDVFMKLTNGIEPGRLKMTWSFVSCPISTDMYICKKDGSNPTWLALQPTDTTTGVSSMKINGKDTTMVDSALYYKLESSPGVDLSKVALEITPDDGGAAVQVTLDLSKDGCVSTGKQFSSSGGPSPPSSSAPSVVTTNAPTTATPTTLAPTTLAPTTATPTTAAPTTEAPTTTVATPAPTTTDVPTTTATEAPTTTSATSSTSTESSDVASAPSTTSSQGYSTTTPAPKAQEVSVKEEGKASSTNLSGYFLSALGACAVAAALVVIIRIRRKQWMDKQEEMEYDVAQSTLAARPTNESIAIL
ncbi:hypothetical protein LEN26_006359 [Aphanomyces euteiches]|nr:hypothetical protein AeMF1_003067 [Aphanomyces euteiches]KAH9135843.1 hypothetical protein LEN26_006359 [Aphanomyces euteiches]KAH9191871.1 hypothetical protein AeNC1_006157 [Aphanomyces euteiches]